MVPNGFGHITRDGLKTFCIVPYLVQCCVIFLTKNSVALITGVSLLVRYSELVPISCFNFKEEQGVPCSIRLKKIKKTDLNGSKERKPIPCCLHAFFNSFYFFYNFLAT